MLYQKYNSNNRDRIVICSQDTESITSNIYSDVHNQVKESLNEEYRQSTLDLAPYHYIVFTDGIEQLKSCDLSHNDNGIFSVFNDDIKILLMDNRILTDDNFSDIKDSLIQIIAEVSAKYSLVLSNNIQFVSFEEQDYSTVISDLERKAIIKRNNLDKDRNFMKQYEYINDLGEITINDEVVTENNSRSHINLSYFADKYKLPISALTKINISLTSNSVLQINDTIFLPAKTSGGNYTICYALDKIRRNRKTYKYIYKFLEYKINKVGR